MARRKAQIDDIDGLGALATEDSWTHDHSDVPNGGTVSYNDLTDKPTITPPTTTAENDFQVGGVGGTLGTWVKKTLAETITILRTSLDSIYAAIVHDHSSATTGGTTLQVDKDIYRFGFVANYAGTQETTIAFDGTNTFTLAPTGANWSYYRSGIKYTISTSKTCTLSGSPPASKGLYYIYIDATDGTLTASTGGWSLEDTKVPVATVAWDNSLTPKYWLSDERHTVAIDRRFHWEHHFSDGTEVVTAPVISGYSVAPAVPADANNTFGITASVTSDEDLKHSLAELTDPNGTATDYVVFFRTAAAVWNWEASAMPYRYTAAGYIQYDSSGTMTEGQNNKFYNTYLLLTNLSGAARFAIVHGQAEFSSLATAQAEKFGSLTKTGISINEFVACYQLTWDTSAGYGTKGKARLAATPVSISISASGSGAGGAIDHATLSNLNSTDYTHLSAANATDLIDGNETTLHKHLATATVNVGTTDRILGRDTAGAGAVEELTLSAVLDFVGSAAQGDILYRGASTWTRLGAGTSGQFLQTLGAGANPAWASVTGTSSVTSVIPGGVLTPTTGVPYINASVSAATHIYYTPALHNVIQLWNGSAWTPTTFTEVDYAITGSSLTSGRGYDVFGYLNSGALALEILVWTSATARATALSMEDGRYCKSGDKTRLYLGSFYSRTTSSYNCQFTVGSQDGGKWDLFNMYNRKSRPLWVKDTTDFWSYNTNTIRQANGAAGNKVEFFLGLQEDEVNASIRATVAVKDGGAGISGIGVDSTTVQSGLAQAGYNAAATYCYSAVGAEYRALLAIGYHYLAWTERGAGAGTVTWLGDDSGYDQAGLFATIWA